MPGFVAPPQPITVTGRFSEPLLLLCTAGLLLVAPDYEGLDPWLLEARQQLDAIALDDLQTTYVTAGGLFRIVEAVVGAVDAALLDSPAESFLEALEQVSTETWACWLRHALAQGDGVPPSDLQDTQAVVAYLRHQPHPPADPLAAAQLILQPERHQERFCRGLRAFWRTAYADVYAANAALLQRSADRLVAQNYHLPFRRLFLTITGRPLPPSLDRFADTLTSVECIPSPHLGPYVVYLRHGTHLRLFYNARLAAQPSISQENELLALYPPLKALGDETRLQIVSLLQGREKYAQEIVNALDISQAAVSRHLKLLVSSGVLSVRKEGGNKFYRLNQETFRRLAAVLRHFGE
ncbi:MAG TPA: ArsR family transcriptional regulator [Anaerolineae bacterium]|nr:ArsR family transcriptional regulator [Anaerolineae bacterium]HIQ05873.1 ArsR family transcriptional regulator [Anaerolineae bacterium]